MSGKKRMLDKILSARTKEHPNESLADEYIEECEVIIAWLDGVIDSSEAGAAFGCSTSQLHQKAGTALRNLRRAGYITISWNPREAESHDAE